MDKDIQLFRDKTKFCKYFTEHTKCPQGIECRFAHGTPLCIHWLRDTCKHGHAGKNCPFSHDLKRLKMEEEFYHSNFIDDPSDQQEEEEMYFEENDEEEDEGFNCENIQFDGQNVYGVKYTDPIMEYMSKAMEEYYNEEFGEDSDEFNGNGINNCEAEENEFNNFDISKFNEVSVLNGNSQCFYNSNMQCYDYGQQGGQNLSGNSECFYNNNGNNFNGISNNMMNGGMNNGMWNNNSNNGCYNGYNGMQNSMQNGMWNNSNNNGYNGYNNMQGYNSNGYNYGNQQQQGC